MAQWSKEVFAKNLRKYMESSGKTQKDMAEIVGVSTATFSEWINAKKYPRIDRIEIMANYFGIQKSDLIEEKTTAENSDGLTESHLKLLELAKGLPEDKAELLLQLMRSMLGES